MHPIEKRLADLGVTLPDAPAPAANYVPFVQVGTLVHISGQISQNEAGLIKGKLGEDAFLRALMTGDRLALGPTAPACGLVLTRVDY